MTDWKVQRIEVDDSYIKKCICIDVDNLNCPVIIKHDGVDWSIDQYINHLIDERLKFHEVLK